MENSNNNRQVDAKLQIAFPKSNEDHRLQLISINSCIFALLHSPLESDGPIRLDCEEWSLVLLAPIKSKTNIHISATNVICLNEIASEEGAINIHASNRLIKFEDDPGAFLHYHQLFDNILTHIYNATPDSFAEAQQKFLMSLCTIANKIEGKPDNLDLPKVLGIWNVPYLNN